MYLNCHSYHSLRYGTLSIDDLVSQASALGINELVLTDINTITGVYEFKKKCESQGIKPVAGIEVRKGSKLLYIAIAKEFAGLGEVNKMLTEYNCDGTELPERPNLDHNFIIYSLQNNPEGLKENEYIGIRQEELNLLIRSEYRNLISKMVILQPVTFGTKKEYNLHRILRAIDNNTLLSLLPENEICHKSEYFKSPQSLLDEFKYYPQIIENTKRLLSQCSFDFAFSTPRNKKHYTGTKADDLKLLTRLAYAGLEKRYGRKNEQAKLRVEKELKVIDELDFSGYFLITWDIIQYSNSMGFMHVGRGSGANSIVAYCIGITDICPLELDLYFERFLNLNRKSPPDFDIDWSWQKRDIILDYIFNRYGKDYVAFCGTNVEFKYRSIIREVGKAFGLPKEELDELSKNPESVFRDEIVQKVQKYGKLLEKFPNQRSMHACGILISEEPLTNFTALEMPPKGFPIVQWDMYMAEELGFEKLDILSQRGLGTIKDTVRLIEEKRGIKVDIKDTALSKDEKICNEFLSQGRTIGCFYIESPAMRGLLRRLKCDNYKVLVAASSIIRPGVAQSGMMREYIFRHNNPNQFEYFHKVFEEELGETYGIMVYQEDVIKIALHFGGLSAADGDILRRAMSGKYRSLEDLQKVKNHFFESCRELGHSEELSREVYRQIESFAGYSFCKAHSASYAVESYQSLYLKVYYPLEFMVSAINNMGGFYRTEVYVHEAKMSGGKILNPCVNKSEYETTIYGDNIYLGLMLLEKVESKIAQLIPEERRKSGDYLSMEDFIKRIPVGIETLQILIFIGAFRFTGIPKNELLLKARVLLGEFKPEHRLQTLFDTPVKDFKLPELKRNVFEDAFDEIEILSFPVSCTPFDLLQTKYKGQIMASDLVKYHKREVKMLAYLIARKHVPTKRGTMFFGTWIDVEGNYFDTAHFPDCLEKYPFQGGGCYLLLGTVEVDFHFPTITVTKMAKMPFIPDPRYSHDEDKRYETQEKIKEDVSMTFRAPYPQDHEIRLPRKSNIK
ncbi:DNA polymerase III subunit alpha [Chryseobacterium gleum]|uniref:DNA-directed DNA polymerase n=2 Tax=Chryseobacterium gleum TaxID=250 RepID=A0A448AX40_CHRGE|nr:DNA polymerase III subunit alpha [Chryseobacterium gleum]EFK34997.1 DNA polymerase III, alpha subunit [Chryseobacterium gleum ATCC 35910]QQY30806.1 DNA polymerase III subunit alpha [Chryseobacterium gleum]VEE04838.1 DNA polymerase III subunit alpha [Chryseobacterium gleum]